MGNANYSFFISIMMIFVVMYFLIIRPQSKKQKEREAMLKKVGKGERIVTTGGLFGTVVGVKGDDVLLVKFGDNRPIEVSRAGIAAAMGQATDAESS